ncbi:FAD:protein FMN transferase [Massilia sp. W12]|uniref:FAD:protein FMN transferase n=1 Tax=Massilia sp. W12 TaxID=3126507 RepID=UPI0030D107B0
MAAVSLEQIQPLPANGAQAQFCYAFAAMACRCEVVLAAPSAAQGLQLAQLAQAEVQRIEAKYSRYRADSVLSGLNASAGGAPCALDAESAALLDYAAALYQESGGLFDISAGVLRRAWDFRSGRRPSPDALQALLPLVGWPRIQRFVEQGQHWLQLPAGMEVDFGGFGKEYAADRAAAILQQAGVAHGYLNLGGDMRILGPQSDGQPWRIAIQHPRQPQQSIASLALAGGALTTSGDYERFLIEDGQRHCHILLPHSGQSVRYFQSVSVIAPLAIVAGSACTLAMLMQQDGEAYLQNSGLAWLTVGPSGEVKRCDLPGEGAGVIGATHTKSDKLNACAS